MEGLIRQAFLHIEAIGPHVSEGHYDLVGPNGDIILPQVWETVIEPDWTITMHMWPLPEKPKDHAPPPALAGTGKKKADPSGMFNPCAKGFDCCQPYLAWSGPFPDRPFVFLMWVGCLIGLLTVL